MFAMVSTTILRKLQAIKSSAPDWVKTSVMFVENSRIGQLFIYENIYTKEFINSDRDEENLDIIGNVVLIKTHENSWKKFSIIIERSTLFAAFFTYLLMIILLSPGPFFE